MRSEGILDFAREFLERDRFGQQLSEPDSSVADDFSSLTAIREIEDLEQWAAHPCHARQVEPVQAGHHHIGEHEIERLVTIEDIERLEPAIRRDDGMTSRRKSFLKYINYIFVIIDNQNTIHSNLRAT
jgi:hypothetical protein